MALRQPDARRGIVRNPRVLGGEPIVRETRIPVRSIVLAAREYESPDGVLDAYRQLSVADIREALAFYELRRPEIDRYIRANADDD